MRELQRNRGRPSRCRDLRYRVLMYAEGELEGSERDAVEAHLKGCEACRRLAEELGAVTLAVRALRDEAAAGPDAACLARIVRQRATERRGLRSLVAQLNSWADDVAGPVLEHPAEALLASGLVLWLAISNVAGAFGLERLMAKLAALALARVSPLGI
ncbi:MAG: zf-HC2 domain-containing protein [Bacillota bacterium]|nr:zf-HC2 domain-containing protein [Bacillota bacterium]